MWSIDIRNIVMEMDIRTQILTLLGSVKRPGMDALLDFIESSDFFTVNCYGHHFIGEGGVAQHSMEVYDYMRSHNILGLSEGSLILCSFTHDLGKTSQAKRTFGGRHDQRSLSVLQHCGVPLSEAEQTAILNHEPGWAYRAMKAATCPLYALLVAADCHSTGTWKREHADAVAQRRARRAARHNHRRGRA